MPTFTNWQKSSFSPDGSNCLEVGVTETIGIELRESDDPALRHSARCDPQMVIRYFPNGKYSHRLLD
ncbi:DUF397 domain-containing protein [Streptomyces sp. ISL-99]|uniref:DUF397 domain-containing protein n=1 Tax=Streptomyces sp. ISL-99 TaxID=2819193 RepID=UPI001BE8BB17|nr:DUF397 domain-containing protein [Streptomyces sp. ISL-99]MBT2527015.1 DUF397 domain-containing protein [Streptomyces sp. ISL-99]